MSADPCWLTKEVDAEVAVARFLADFTGQDRIAAIHLVLTQLRRRVEPDRVLASWHFRDPSGTVFSAGAAFAPLLRLLPGGSPLAAFASRFPRGVERAYRFVASNRGVFGALVGSGARARADRRLTARRPGL